MEALVEVEVEVEGVTEACARVRRHAMGEEVSSLLSGAQVQSQVTTCTLGQLGGSSERLLCYLQGHPTGRNRVGPTTWGPVG